MGDELLLILKEFLNVDSLKEVINLPVGEIIQQINRNIASGIEDAKTLFNDLLLNQNVLKQNMELNETDTLLHFVARNGTVESAVQLLKYGSDVHALNNQKESPIFNAIRNSAEIFRVLLDNSKVINWDLFHQVLLFGTEEIFVTLVHKRLLEIQKDLAQDAMSVVNNKIDDIKDAINSFLKDKIHLQHKNESYPLLIFFAARIYRKDILQIILDDCRKNFAITIKVENLHDVNGIKIHNKRVPEKWSIQGECGKTALHYAASHQLVQVARFLLEQGADPSCRDQYRCTPLHLAAFLKNEEMWRLLLSFGTKINLECNGGQTPLNLICGKMSKLLTSMANFYCFNVTKDFSERRTVFNHQIIKLLLEHGADPNTLNEDVPALSLACQFSSLEDVKILFEADANTRALDKRGNSALHYAACGSSLEIVDFLLEKGFDIELRNHLNSTPLMFALTKQRYNVEMIEYLLYRGADINSANIHGETPLFSALSLNSNDVEWLLELGADWLILNTNESEFNRNLWLSVGSGQKVLISFIALRENVLNDNIKFYVGNTDEKLREAFEYFENSKLEITKLKTTTVANDCKTNYFDFLTNDFYTCVQIVKNSDLKTFLLSNEYKKMFPCYKRFLKYRFKMTQGLENFVDQTFNFISQYTNLPVEIVEMIISYLRTIDFRVFGKVLSNRRL